MASKAGFRIRNKGNPAYYTHLGQQFLIDNAGNDILGASPQEHLNYPDLEVMHDETHRLVRPKLYGYWKYYHLQGTGYRGSKRLFGQYWKWVYGRPVHNSGGPLNYYHLRTFPQPEVQGVGTYYGRDLRPYGFAAVYSGGFVPLSWPHGYSIVDYNNASFSGPFSSEYEDPTPYAASAYNRFKPKISHFDAMQGVLQNLVELPKQLMTTSEGLSDAYKAMVGSKRARDVLMPDNIANQFINEQFGWAPFIGDARDLYRAYNNQDRLMADITRQNGNWIKRGGNVLKEDNIEEYANVSNASGYVYPSLTSDFYRGSGSFVDSHLYSQIEREVWFDGSFKFYAPEFDSLSRAGTGTYGKIMQMMHYYGVRISPTVVWELTPWTWLVDWFSNAGDIIDNVTSQVFDRLVSRYAYIMQRSRKWVCNDSIIHLQGGDVTCSWTQQIVTKKRRAASPYGFDLSNGDLSVRQKLILGALGVTHLS